MRREEDDKEETVTKLNTVIKEEEAKTGDQTIERTTWTRSHIEEDKEESDG